MKRYIYLLSFFLTSVVTATFGQVTNSGGDNFGYKFTTNLAAADPAVYEWVDISTTGTLLTGFGDDNIIGPISLGINFKYYWNTYTQCYVGSNGYIMFDDNQLIAQGANGMPNIPLSTDGKGNFIAPFLADLTHISHATGAALPSAKVLYQTIGDKFIITFDSVPFWNNTAEAGPEEATGRNSFQLILDGTTNNIQINYKSSEGPWFTGSSGVLVQGMENITGGLGNRWRRKNSANVALPPAGSAVKVVYPLTSNYSFKDVQARGFFTPDNKGAAMFTGVPGNLKAYVRNAGTVKVTTPTTFRAFVYDGLGNDIFNDQLVVDSFQVGEERIITFPQIFNPGDTAASYKVELKTTATGDQFAANNTRLAKLVVLDSTEGSVDLRFTKTKIGLTNLSQSGNSGMIFDPPYQPMVISHISVDLVWPDVAAWDGLGFPGVQDSLTKTFIGVYMADGPNGGIGTLIDSFTIDTQDDYPYDTVGSELVNGTVANYVFRYKKPLQSPFSWYNGARIYVGAIHNNVTNFVWNAPYAEIYPLGTPASGRSLEITGNAWGENRGKDSIDIGVGIVGDPLAVAVIPVVKLPTLSIDQNVPNPATAITTIGVVLPQAGKVEVVLRDVTGREVKRQQFNGAAGKQNLKVNLEGLSPQMYYYTVQHSSGIATKRLIIK